MPGDELVPDPPSSPRARSRSRRRAEAVWPWLAQIGQDRAGFYSYEWLENLAGCQMHNADEIHPEWQRRELGETVYLHPLNGLPVTRFEPGRVLALEGWGAFVLEPHGPGDTRLIARGRTPRGLGALANALLMEIPHFVMERKMLLGIKERAEQTHTAALRRAMQATPLEERCMPEVLELRDPVVRTTVPLSARRRRPPATTSPSSGPRWPWSRSRSPTTPSSIRSPASPPGTTSPAGSCRWPARRC